ncbi:MAG: hypothetical protein KAJ55_00185 [Anaerolineales bacterium]|nr:hypothetical protein [Anaerolineales bacterium]
MSERVNIYDCRECGGQTVTVDRVAGVTPFMLGCRVCGKGIAYSRRYQVPEDHKEPTHEWYKPTKAQAKRQERKHPGSLHHWEQGGLSIRAIAPSQQGDTDNG